MGPERIELHSHSRHEGYNLGTVPAAYSDPVVMLLGRVSFQDPKTTEGRVLSEAAFKIPMGVSQGRLGTHLRVGSEQNGGGKVGEVAGIQAVFRLDLLRRDCRTPDAPIR